MNDAAAQKKWWAKAILIGAIVAAVSLPVGALGSKFGLWGFQGGFALLGVGVVLATIAFFLGVIALFVAINKKLTAERSSVLIGVVISAVILGIMGMQFSAATSVPPIHNISTDIDRPPEFDKIAQIREAENAPNPLEYDADILGDQQRAAYPFVKPLISQSSPTEMFDRAVEVLEGMGLEIVNADAGSGQVEATATTFWFGFKDDVVVRIRPEGGGSVVDVRSVSRVGQSDLGTNARRIGEILEGLSQS